MTDHITQAAKAIYEAMRYAADPFMPENVPAWGDADPTMREVALATAEQVLLGRQGAWSPAVLAVRIAADADLLREVEAAILKAHASRAVEGE